MRRGRSETVVAVRIRHAKGAILGHCAQFLGDHADRPRPFTGPASIVGRGVAAEFELEIGDHDVAVW
jgi:hypothetical protein